MAQQLIAGQRNPPALLLQGLCQVCHWGYAHQAALLVQGDCVVLSMQILQYLLASKVDILIGGYDIRQALTNQNRSV